jgi:hypothetical protein
MGAVARMPINVCPSALHEVALRNGASLASRSVQFTGQTGAAYRGTNRSWTRLIRWLFRDDARRWVREGELKHVRVIYRLGAIPGKEDGPRW